AAAPGHCGSGDGECVSRDVLARSQCRFARSALSADDFHVAPPRRLHLDTVFRLHEERVVSNDWVVRYANRHFQLERQSGQAPARSTVVVAEDVAGDIEIRYRGQRMRWTEIIAGAVAPVSASRVIAPTAVTPPTGAHRPRVVAAPNHPWRHTRVRPNW